MPEALPGQCPSRRFPGGQFTRIFVDNSINVPPMLFRPGKLPHQRNIIAIPAASDVHPCRWPPDPVRHQRDIDAVACAPIHIRPSAPIVCHDGGSLAAVVGYAQLHCGQSLRRVSSYSVRIRTAMLVSPGGTNPDRSHHGPDGVSGSANLAISPFPRCCHLPVPPASGILVRPLLDPGREYGAGPPLTTSTTKRGS
jgi:hypothetical protein